MKKPKQETIRDWVKATLLWFALGLSTGLYYTATYFGGRGWPLPHPESLAAPILYYFSVLNVDTKIQAIHWMVAFPLAGVLWVGVLSLTSPFFEGRNALFSYTLLRFGLAALPVALAGPVLAYLAGASAGGGFSWNRMVDVALRRASMTPPAWLNPLFLILATAALVLQIRYYLMAYETRGKQAWAHYVTSAILTMILACGLGTLAAVPLRAWIQ